MVEAAEFQRLTPSLALWQAYDPTVKADLVSTAARVGDSFLLIDPIPLAAASLQNLLGGRSVTGILITNSNHLRAGADLALAHGVSVYCDPLVSSEFRGCGTISLAHGMEIMPEVTAIALQGAAPGEFAFHFADDGGTLVVGDALINLDPYGFSLLPAKYCEDQKELRRSLRQLLAWPFERLLFAHGTPTLSRARQRLETLLQ